MIRNDTLAILMTNACRTAVMPARSKNPNSSPRKVLETSHASRCAGAAAENDASSGGGGGEEDPYRTAADFLRDFHQRAHTLDVIYEEGRDPTGSGTSSRGNGTSLAGAPHMRKVRTTGSLLDLVPTDGERIVDLGPNRHCQQLQQQRESDALLLSPFETGSRDDVSNSTNAAMEWGYFGDDDNEDPSSVVIDDESEARRINQGTTARRILHSSCQPRFHAHRPHRRQPHRHFPNCAGQPLHSEKDRPSF